MNPKRYTGVMNNTKGEEIRFAMHDYPKKNLWRVKNIDNGFISNWDGEWFSHFALGGYRTI